MPKSNLSDTLKKSGAKMPRRRTSPLWEGPESDGENGGITFSSLSRFIQCRERFRVKMMEGLKPADGFNHFIEYGQMWHVCEERFAAGGVYNTSLLEYCKELVKKYPLSQEKIDKWYNMCLRQFPEYVKFWEKHPDIVNRRPLLQEHVFCVPYELPSGRVVYLRGKWDSVDLVEKGANKGVWWQENKTKSEIDITSLTRQLTFDLQTMMYLVAGHSARYDATLNPIIPKGAVIRGVRYNVIRRPLSGGKGNVKQLGVTKANPQGETLTQYYDRAAQYIKEEPENYFCRFNVEVGQSDIERFKDKCLNPLLESLCQWYEAEANVEHAHPHVERSWVHPFGVRNILDEGGSSDLDEYLVTGSEVGLVRAEYLFRELKDIL